MRKNYPSDISREQFAIIKPLLESARRKTVPRRVDLYEVFCAVLYLLRSGCQWHMLPEEFPKWRTVHAYFAIWSEPREGSSLLQQALKNQIVAARERRVRNASSRFLIVDAQSVKNTDTAVLKGYDAGKKVSVIKRHMAVDTARVATRHCGDDGRGDGPQRSATGTAALQVGVDSGASLAV